MEFSKSLAASTSGLKAQSGRMRIIAENIANADSAPASRGAEPYRRKIPTFTSHLDRETGANVVETGRVRRDTSAFRVKHDPGNPVADANGYGGVAEAGEASERFGFELRLVLDALLQLQAGGARRVGLRHQRAKRVLIGVLRVGKIEGFPRPQVDGKPGGVAKRLFVVAVNLRLPELADQDTVVVGVGFEARHHDPDSSRGARSRNLRSDAMADCAPASRAQWVSSAA